MLKKWETMTREQLKSAADAGSVVVVTIGAMEQHGPHLPVHTDNVIMTTIGEASVTKASAHIPVVLGPHIPFGYSPHHFLYAGAISLSVETLLQLLKDVVESVIKSGFKKIFLLNSHGGNGEIIRIAMKDLHEQYSTHYIGAASYWEVAQDTLTVFKEKNDVFDVGHAGQFETSIMMAVEEQYVDLAKLQKGDPNRQEVALEFPAYVLLTPNNIWETMDGFSDDPTLATKQFGERIIQIVSDEVSNILQLFYER